MNKEIQLTEDELKQLMKGTLLWSDIAPRLNPSSGARSGIRKLGTPLSPRDTNSPNPSDPIQASDRDKPLYPEREDLFPEKQIPPERYSDLKEVQALLVDRGETYQRTFEGAKAIVLLSFAGVAVVSLWLYYFLNA